MINQVTSNTADFLKSQEYLKTLKINSLKIREKGLEQKSMLKKKSPKFYKKITNAFFYFFELIHQKFQDNVFDILANIAGLGQHSRIGDAERHAQEFGQRACDQCLAGSSRANQQYVGLLQIDINLCLVCL